MLLGGGGGGGQSGISLLCEHSFRCKFVVQPCPAVVLLSAETEIAFHAIDGIKLLPFPHHRELPYWSVRYVNVVVRKAMFRLCCEPKLSPFVAVGGHQNFKPKCSIHLIGIAKKLDVRERVSDEEWAHRPRLWSRSSPSTLLFFSEHAKTSMLVC